MERTLKIATRGSTLALWQANHIKSLIVSANPSVKVTITVVKTSGDRIQDRPLLEIGGKGLFVKEIQASLLAEEADIAVHSLKDYPAVNPDELRISCVPPREDPRDVLVVRKEASGKALREGANIGTGSLRRGHQARMLFPSCKITGIRGNVETRLSKVDDGSLDAVILAAAGLKRLGFENRICRAFSPEEIIPAVGQGALAVETRKNDRDLIDLLTPLQDTKSRTAIDLERKFLTSVGGSCTTPIGIHARIESDDVSIRAFLASIDGSRHIRKHTQGPVKRGKNLIDDLVDSFMQEGADELLQG